MDVKNDWRLQGQESYLKNKRLYKSEFKINSKNNDHAHCEFCWKKFSECGTNDSLNIGYSTKDKYHWICCDCYEDFKDIFNWKLLVKGKEMKWRFVGSTTEDKFIIDGIDIFKEKWESTGEVADVIDPLYGQPFKFNVWRVENEDEIIIFAAGEFSNNVFGIYCR
ncbi:hypothetical protein [Alkaliphilus peptidifermentans]|uniref:Uncharacterized protein n=1 Tax=Alkaliphilus peptidifermentans DSM 18978 TaxID=1120976 RepID=A0A1G5LG49_9FIRM|nr:hypothetical protein [Alkaliphilus peptidifermentans]SCZ11220.1 hypothetical protein SAMN03080606_04348 [Alkaliphilus peptidifermentans DSM 18978]